MSRFADERVMPLYPIYIPSKGRAEYPYSIRMFSRMRIPFYVVVEEPERAAYDAVLERFGGYGRALTLDPEFQRSYDACMDLAPGQSPGSGPARNFAWEHARAAGHGRYWCVDDNITDMYYYRQNRKIYSGDSAPIRLMEEFVDRYTNVAMAGPHYYMFIPRKAKVPPFTLNTRIYSFNLIKTDLTQRWRGRYNEDTILSLDLLKAGYCTVLFNAYLANKLTTQVLPGGNTSELYGAGTLEKSQMLVREHPDVARLADRFGRDHHYVDYKRFRARRLIRREDAGVVPEHLTRTVVRERSLTPLRGTKSATEAESLEGVAR